MYENVQFKGGEKVQRAVCRYMCGRWWLIQLNEGGVFSEVMTLMSTLAAAASMQAVVSAASEARVQACTLRGPCVIEGPPGSSERADPWDADFKMRSTEWKCPRKRKSRTESRKLRFSGKSCLRGACLRACKGMPHAVVTLMRVLNDYARVLF
jgi:hypothetical protein